MTYMVLITSINAYNTHTQTLMHMKSDSILQKYVHYFIILSRKLVF